MRYYQLCNPETTCFPPAPFLSKRYPSTGFKSRVNSLWRVPLL